MKPHVKIYLKYFDLEGCDFVPCEICKSKAVDIHHINGRGVGKDVIKNLCALCRDHHNDCHNEIIDRGQMLEIHLEFLKMS